MKIYSVHKEIPKLSNTVITVGSFDGLHRGHKKVLQRLIALSKEKKAESVVFTFEPHPRIVLDSENDQVKMLTNKEEKILLFRDLGIDHLVIFSFTKDFAEMSPEEFIVEVLLKRMGMRTLLLGFDHFFGRKRQGSIETIKNLASKYAFEHVIVDAAIDSGEKISSTKIRKAIIQGNLFLANNYLGHPYVIYGKVISGYQIGTKIGFPTANLKIENRYKLMPNTGVYAVKGLINEEWKDGMMNYGVKPTLFEKAERTLEIHIFDLEEKIYGKTLTIALIEKIREEKKFSSVEELVEQIKSDKIKTKKILNEHNA